MLTPRLVAARPFGIKLHAELSSIFGQLLTAAIRIATIVAVPVWRYCASLMLYLLALLSAVCGELCVSVLLKVR